ncbi:MAG: DUF4760 domain-containing protein [Geminicoccaceae bacterium]
MIDIVADNAFSSWEWLRYTAGLNPFVTIFAVVAALIGIVSARQIARSKVTLDFIEKKESTSYYRRIHNTFSLYRKAGRLAFLYDPKTDEDRAARTDVFDYLNHYEIVSIGILERVLSGRIYKKWMRGPFVRDWNAAAELIQRERWKWHSTKETWVYYDSVFQHYQIIARRWSKDTHHLDRHTSGPPTTPSGPGDELFPPAPDNHG